jgi:hypothetical protein
MRDHGVEAYYEARHRERDVILRDGTTHEGRTPAHWRKVALIVAKKTGHAVGLDAATKSEARGRAHRPRQGGLIASPRRQIGGFPRETSNSDASRKGESLSGVRLASFLLARLEDRRQQGS